MVTVSIIPCFILVAICNVGIIKVCVYIYACIYICINYQKISLKAKSPSHLCAVLAKWAHHGPFAPVPPLVIVILIFKWWRCKLSPTYDHSFSSFSPFVPHYLSFFSVFHDIFPEQNTSECQNVPLNKQTRTTFKTDSTIIHLSILCDENLPDNLVNIIWAFAIDSDTIR